MDEQVCISFKPTKDTNAYKLRKSHYIFYGLISSRLKDFTVD